MKALRSALGAIAMLGIIAPLACAQTYSVTDLGSLNGAPTFATAINDAGIVAGYALPDENTARAWVFQNGALAELPGLGGSDTRALAVGADGKVYGYSTDAAGLAHAVRWENGALIDLGPASGSEGWLAQAVNASGVVVGHTGGAGAPVLGFKLDGATFISMGTLPGATPPATSAAYDLNDAGQIVGVASWVGGGTRAFRTDAAGAIVSIGTLGANDSYAMAIDSAGNVVGHSTTAANEIHAFYFTDAGGMKDLGVLSGGHESHAFGLNDSGYVVGTAETSTGASRAVVWPATGALRDLNELIPPNSGWTLAEAQDINTGGDIVGNGTIGGETHAFLIERYEGADTLAPIVIGSVAVTNGSPSSIVTVNFWDNEKVVGATTHLPGMIRVTGPNGYNAIATVQSWYAADRQASTSTFIFTPPGGSWDGGDNGVYEIVLAANVVSDLAANLHPGGVIGSFTVGMQTVPVLNWITLPTTATLGAAVNLSFGAFGSYPAAAGDLFTVAVDWDGDGAVIESFPGLASGANIAHAFTSLGTHTVRVRVTDPHGLTSSERTAQISVSNPPGLPVLGEVLDTPIGYYNGATGGAVAAENAGTIYLFGGYPLSNDNSPIVTWNYATPGAQFIFRGDFDNGPILFEGAGVDGRGRIVIYGGYEPGGGATASCRTYTIAGGPGGGVASKPSSAYGATARDNLGRLYSINTAATYRYTAGTSGSGSWATFAAPPFAAACASYDGAGHVIAFASLAGTGVASFDVATGVWSALPNAPASISRAALGADGFLYAFSGTNIYTLDPASGAISILGQLNQGHGTSPVVSASDGFIYLIGGAGVSSIERLDTRSSATLAPRISSTPAGTTVVQGNPWTYQIAASGKPRPAFALVRGPAGMTVSATGLVSWTPLLPQVGPQTALVRASNSAGTAEQFITFNVLAVAPDTTPPSAPTDLAAFNITTNSADTSWSPSTDNIGVTGYRIFEKRRRYSGRGRPMTTYYAQVGATAGTSWHFANLPQCSTRTYYVSAIDAAGNLSAKTAVTFTLQCPPAVYADSSGTFYGRRAIVSEPWTSNVFTATGNPLPTLAPSASPAGAVWHTTSISSGYFTWTAVAGQEGTQTFAVTATSSVGSASLSQTVETYPAGTDLIPPSAPGNLVVDQVSWDSARATWTASTDNYGVALYRVTAAHRQPRRRFHHGAYNDHVVTFTVPAGTTQAAIPGLHASTSYVVTVTAQDTAGLWSYSASANIITLPQPFVLESAVVTTTENPDGSTTMTWPGYGYYWKFTVECSTDLLAWAPVEPASQWPSYATSFTFTPEPGVPQRFYRVKATLAATP